MQVGHLVVNGVENSLWSPRGNTIVGIDKCLFWTIFIYTVFKWEIPRTNVQQNVLILIDSMVLGQMTDISHTTFSNAIS